MLLLLWIITLLEVNLGLRVFSGLIKESDKPHSVLLFKTTNDVQLSHRAIFFWRLTDPMEGAPAAHPVKGPNSFILKYKIRNVAVSGVDPTPCKSYD